MAYRFPSRPLSVTCCALPLVCASAFAGCSLDPAVPPRYEEQRLVNRLPGNDTPFARRILQASGFDTAVAAFSDQLCRDGVSAVASQDEAMDLVRKSGTALWRAAVARAQGQQVIGALPAGDDRPLYWARLTMLRRLDEWKTPWLSAQGRDALRAELERVSRGQQDIVLPPGRKVRRMIVSGFDPFTLGEPGSSTDTHVRIGNPSGALALALDGTEYPLPDGSILHIEAYLLPVSYGPFQAGMQEDTLGPWFRRGPSRVDASLTVSQGRGSQFDLENWNGRYHGVQFPGNDGQIVCAPASDRLPGTGECDIFPPERWYGKSTRPWQADTPAQFTVSSLPFKAMIAANTGAGIRRPSGSEAKAAEGFDVTWNVAYRVFPECSAAKVDVRNEGMAVMNALPDKTPQAPRAGECAESGGGGNYLSNESAYRNTLLRDTMGLSIPAGHIHTPIMNHFAAGNNGKISDEVFESWREAIVEQGKQLVLVVGQGLTDHKGWF